MREALAKLVKVKTFVTFAVIAVFVCLSLRGDIRAEDVMIVVSAVVAFYFGTQSGKRE